MAKMICPICGKEYDEEDMSVLENGNLACIHCVQKELSDEE